jgi:hypothetical protein
MLRNPPAGSSKALTALAAGRMSFGPVAFSVPFLGRRKTYMGYITDSKKSLMRGCIIGLTMAVAGLGISQPEWLIHPARAISTNQ